MKLKNKFTCQWCHTCRSAGDCSFPSSFAAPWSSPPVGRPQPADACSPGKPWRGSNTSGCCLQEDNLQQERKRHESAKSKNKSLIMHAFICLTSEEELTSCGDRKRGTGVCGGAFVAVHGDGQMPSSGHQLHRVPLTVVQSRTWGQRFTNIDCLHLNFMNVMIRISVIHLSILRDCLVSRRGRRSVWLLKLILIQ